AGNGLSPAGFDARLRDSDAVRELRAVRNVKPGFKKGLWFGLANAALETALGGRTPWTLKVTADCEALEKLDGYRAPDRGGGPRDLAPRDRLAGVYFAATEHDDAQPVHLLVPDTSA